MSTILRNIQIPLFIKIEKDCLSRIQHILDEQHLQFRKPLIISEPHILEAGGNEIVHALGDPATILLTKNSIAEGERIAALVREKHNDVIVSIGGGRVLDLGKYAATKARVNYISVPTTPSNDGIASPVAVLTNEDGITESLPVDMPVGILVDPQMLTGAPRDNVLSGIGDMIGKFSSIQDWQLAYAAGKETYDDFAASIARSSAQMVYGSLRGVEVDIQSEDFLEKLVNALILSGVAMNIAGSSRPCSGAEHKISHALDAMYPGRSMHGLQVLYGTLLMEFLRGNDVTEFLEFSRKLNFPTTHEALGFTTEEMIDAIAFAPETREDRYTILEEKNLSKNQIADLLERYSEFVAA